MLVTVFVGGVHNVKQGNPFEKVAFFSKSRLTLQKWLLMIHFWAWQCPVTDTLQQIQIGKMNAVDIYRWLREVCSTKLLSTPIILGGPGIVVEIDVSLFRHKPKVSN